MMSWNRRDALPTETLDEAVLRRYLPEEALACLRDGGQARDLEALTPHLERLAGLLQTISTYIPGDIVQDQLTSPVAGRVRGQEQRGTLLYADVSGFTAMSESLAALGKVGAEEITRVVNGLFTDLLAAATRQSGTLLLFGGDSLIVFFGGSRHAARAVHCALSMRRVVRLARSVKTLKGAFPLQIAVGLHSGAFFRAEAGSRERMAVIITGREVNRTAAVKELAEPGQVIISAETLALAGPQVSAGPHAQGCWQVTGQSGHRYRAPAARPWYERRRQPVRLLKALVERIEALRPYLVEGVYSKITADPGGQQVEGELRPVTVLFANVAGLGAGLAETGQKGAAETTARLNGYFTRIWEIVHRYGGIVNKVSLAPTGDALMALFGAPVAHEDDPQRAVRAALEMQAAVAEMNRTQESGAAPAGELISQRIGINSGYVFAGNVGSRERREYTVMGDAVNVADRIMWAAGPSQVLVSNATWHKVAARFEGEELAPIQVKGKAEAVSVHRIRGVQAGAPRPRPALGGLHRSRLVGRAAEVATLRAAAERALGGQGEAVGVVGQAGTGKSRLLEEITNYVTGAVWPVAILATECQSYGQSMAYLPFVTLLRHYFGLTEDAEPAQAAGAVVSAVSERAGQAARFAPLLGPLLGLPIPENDVTLSLTPPQRRQRMMELVRSLLYAEARRQPLMIVLGDVHWMDDSSRALLDLIIQELPTVPLFLAMDYRPDFSPPWRERACYGQVTAGELDEQAALDMASSMLDLPVLPDGLRQAIVAKSQGNPLFIEEIVKSLVEAGSLARQGDRWILARPAAGAAIPDTIQGVILSRLDCLDEGSRHAAQMASVIGTRFRYHLLKGVYPQPGELPRRLANLNAMDLIAPEDHPADPTYVFTHVLTQEVAYESLLFARRREVHGRIAACMESLYAERLDEQLEVLALHTLRAEEWERALDYHLRAGRKALALYANEGAVAFLTSALEIAGRCAGDTTALRLESQELLGDAQFNMARLDAALASYEEARRLWREPAPPAAPPTGGLPALLRKVGIVHERKGDYASAYRCFEEGLALLEEAGAAGESLEAARLCGAMAGTLYRQGRYAEARTWALRAQDSAERLHSERDTAHFYNLLGTIGWELGQPEQAIAYRQKSLSLYEALGDLNGLAAAHNNLGIALFHFGRWSEAMPHLRRSLELRQRIGDSIGEATVLLNMGEAQTGLGDLADAAESCRRALAMFSQAGYRWGAAVAKSNLGGVCTFLHRWEEAETFLTESRRDFEQIGSRSFLPEVHRRQAELAQEQGAWPESREKAATSLALAVELNSPQEEGIARRVLARTEAALGDTAQARALLQQSLNILQGLSNEYETAKTLLQMTLLEEGGGAAAHHRQEAVAIFQRLGARRDLELARAA